MKKNYIAPVMETIEVRTISHLMDPSITGASMEGFSGQLTIGGTTSEADSRRDLWDWEDEDFE